MCGIRDCDHSEPSTVGRRKFLGAAAAAPLAMAPSMLGIPDAVASSSGLVTPARRFGRVDMPEIRRRTDWAPDLPVRKPIEAEDVKFLLVHHTADPDSNYQPDDVVGMLRKIYDYHTGAEKDWPDIAYNFFVDKFGRIWESRTGSVDSPLRGDATGGNQGFSQLCCFLGDFEAEQPPQEAVMSMIALLTWLADKHGLNMTPGATTTFTSRGSNKWPEGSEITTQTISTHRQMSETTCPGTACHELVTTRFQQMVSDQLPTKAPATTSSPATVSTTTPPTNDAATTTAATADSTAASADTEPSAQSTTAKPDTEEQAEAKIPVAADDDGGTNWPIALGASAAAVTAAGALGYGLWSKSRSEEPTPLAATGSDFAASDASTLTAPLASDLIARPSPAEFVSLAGAGVGDDVPTATTVDSPVTWWRPGAPSGSAGAASADEVLVFWLAGSGYTRHSRDRIQSSMRSSLERLGGTAGSKPGPWFTQMLSTILPGLQHPADGGLVLGLATRSDCLALTVGNARIEVPGVAGNHRPRPSLPGIDPRSGMAHRWSIPAADLWVTTWLGGPGTLSVSPETIGSSQAARTDHEAELLGSTEGYLGVRLDR